MPPVLYILVVFLLMPNNTNSAHVGRSNCSTSKKIIGMSIGVIIDRKTRMGREQEIAMKIAVQDIYRDTCIQLSLHIRDSSANSSPVTSTALNLIHKNKVQALIAALSFPEAVVLSEVLKDLYIPVIFLSPTATLSPYLPTNSSNFIQMSDSISIHMQCLVSIFSYFQLQRVSIIYERTSAFSLDSGVISVLSDSLKSVESTIDQHLAFPSVDSLSDSDNIIEKKLSKLRNGTSHIFVLLQSSVELATRIFRIASEMGMVEKGFVWIISDEVASLLDSLDYSILAHMQGIIGYRTNFLDTSELYKSFKVKFARHYLAKYVNDQENSNPSFISLRAYDAIQVIFKARKDQRIHRPNFMMTNFVGLSGNISFKNGMLERTPTFKIINVVGNGYRELAFWAPGYGFSMNPPTQSGPKDYGNEGEGTSVKLGPIYWPGGLQTVPRGLSFGVGNVKALRIGVPGSGAFHPFVNVKTDDVHNKTHITGFSVDVFKTSLKYLPYRLPFVFIPFYGTYDELVHKVYQKDFDAAVGDINILEERYKWADFSQPYSKSGMVMVVTVKEDKANEMWMFLTVFDRKMWAVIPLMGLFMGFVVCLIEHSDDPQFTEASFSQQVQTIFWFSFTLLVFAQKESPKSHLSKFVLAPWHFLVLMLTIYFTAALTSLMTVSQLLPTVKDVDTLRSKNAAVGCNWNSFLCPYLVDVEQFKPENIRPMRSIEEFHIAFQRGEIKAAFFVTSHAQVFLAKYCKGYTIAGPTYYFGGLSFAFQRGSPLSIDMSQAMLKATEKGEIDMLERELLARYQCSASTTNSTSTSAGLKPFSGLFYISGGIASIALLITVIPIIMKRWRITPVILEAVLEKWRAWMHA